MRRERAEASGQAPQPARGRLRLLELAAAGASLVACVAAGLPWFGQPGVAFTGLAVHGYLAVPILAALALVGLIAVRLAWDAPPSWLAGPAPRPLLALAVIELVFIVIGFLIKPVGLRWQAGGYLAVAAALAAWAAIMVPAGRPRSGR